MRYVSFLFIIFNVLLYPVRAETVKNSDFESLLTNHQVDIQTSIAEQNKDEEQPQIVVNQQVRLVVDVSSTTWFSGGTKIAPIDVPQLVVQQNDLRAMNYARSQQGQTWSHQRWEIPLYPQRAGTFVIPAIAIEITVALENGNNATGVIYTKPQKITVTDANIEQPKGQALLASPKVKLSQQWNMNDSDKYEVGDAIEREVTLVADDYLAMLLPPLLSSDISDNAQRYSEPVILQDTSNRGHRIAARIEKDTYILQTGGTIDIPDIELKWWNTQTQEIETLTLEGKVIVVKHTLSSWLKAYWSYLFVAFLVIILCVYLLRRINAYYKTHPLPDALIFKKALKEKDWPVVRLYLYRRLYTKTRLLELKKLSETKWWKTKSKVIQSEQLDGKKLWKTWFAIKSKSE
ncbi:hypothetical protein C0W80_02010 [Photobacterium leiognathi subsp. mandapamensis]|uniref:BatD family protein n=1 Tax=Photobacterium leiognathi TaxID=553611 RepID=UPI000D1535EE|nr:BatD family protein [Photobacterium leiognathi]PSV04144.1 hypothetical protein C0W80_02010 [Photobacterium leiognathi subsp. mandapamensis]